MPIHECFAGSSFYGNCEGTRRRDCCVEGRNSADIRRKGILHSHATTVPDSITFSFFFFFSFCLHLASVVLPFQFSSAARLKDDKEELEEELDDLRREHKSLKAAHTELKNRTKGMGALAGTAAALSVPSNAGTSTLQPFNSAASEGYAASVTSHDGPRHYDEARNTASVYSQSSQVSAVLSA